MSRYGTWACKRGWHKWSIWTEPIHVRWCDRCGFRDDSQKNEWVTQLVKSWRPDDK